jgi:hypothetical protein
MLLQVSTRVALFFPNPSVLAPLGPPLDSNVGERADVAGLHPIELPVDTGRRGYMICVPINIGCCCCQINMVKNMGPSIRVPPMSSSFDVKGASGRLVT